MLGDISQEKTAPRRQRVMHKTGAKYRYVLHRYLEKDMPLLVYTNASLSQTESKCVQK